MRRFSIIGVLALAAALLMIFAPAAMADGPDIVGNWHGNWKCTPPDCDKPGGGMDGNIQSKGGNHYGGTFHLKNTTIGDISGDVDATLNGNQFNGNIHNSEGTIHFNSNVNGNHVHGSFDGPLGKGTFDLDK